MTGNDHTAGLFEVGTVFVPVSDQDRALAFSVETAKEPRRVASGVELDAVIAGKGTPREGLTSLDASIPDPVPAQFFFRDPDGNRFLIVQP